MVAVVGEEVHCGPRQIPRRAVIPRIPSLLVRLLPPDLSSLGIAGGMANWKEGHEEA